MTDPRNGAREGRRNAVWSGVAYLAGPLAYLLSSPLMLSRLGYELFGIWLGLSTVMTLSGVLSVGLADATIRFVAEYRAANRRTDVIRIIRGSLAAFAGVGLLVAGVLSLNADRVVEAAFSATGGLLPVARVSLIISAWGFLFRMVYAVLEAVARGHERFDIEARHQAVLGLATPLAACALVAAGFGLPLVILAVNMILGITAVSLAIRCSRLVGGWSWLLPRLDARTWREIFGFSFYTWVQGASGIAVQHADRIIVSSSIGPAALSVYGIAVQVAQLVHGLLARTAALTFPMAVKAHLAGDSRLLNGIFRKGMGVTTACGVTVSLGLYLFSHELLTLWMGREFAVKAAPTLSTLALANAVFSTSVIPSYLLNGGGFHRLNALVAASSGCAVVSLGILLAPVWGVIGVALARFGTVPIALVARYVLLRHLLRAGGAWQSAMTLVPCMAALGPAVILVPSWTEPWTATMAHRSGLCGLGMALLAVTIFFQYGPSSSLALRRTGSSD